MNQKDNINITEQNFNNLEPKEWIELQLQIIEKLRQEQKNIPFKIQEIRDKGFIAKVFGLYCYISFSHMPWKYIEVRSWIAVYPKLYNKIFFCKIHKIQRDPYLILIDGGIPQFKKVELITGERYFGVIILKSKYGFLIDIGCHFDWKYGSQIGLLHKSQIRIDRSLDDYVEGDEIETINCGFNDQGKLSLTTNLISIDWNLGIPQKLVGKIVLVKVVIKPEKNIREYLVEGRYKGQMTKSKENPLIYRRFANKIKKELSNGSTIYCEVIRADDKNQILEFKWKVEIETKPDIENNIKNNIDKNTFEKLLILKNNEII